MKNFNNLMCHYPFWIVVLLILFFLSETFANPVSFSITGKLLNAENSEPVKNAVVQIVGTQVYTTSSFDGSFKIENLTQSKIRIKITHLSFQEKLIDLEIKSESDKNITVYLFPKTITLAPVIVTNSDSRILLEESNSILSVLKGKELQKDLGQTLALTLKNATGISIRSMGPAPSRPVFRGLGQDRVLISEDGIKGVDLSATSPDHAVTLEPFTIERIEVYRGPKILTKTSTTIGGVVNVVRNEIPEQIHNTIHLNLGGYLESVNNGFLGAITSELPIEPFALKLEISKRKTDDLSTPTGKILNSKSENFNSAVGISYIKDFGFIGASYRFFDLNYGIPGGFIGAHPKGVNIEIRKHQINSSLSYNLNESDERIKLEVSNIYYRHKEFEYSGRIGSEFRVITTSANLFYDHSKKLIFGNGKLGMQFEYRNFDIGGFVFTPPTNAINLSAFIYENYVANKFNIDFAFRFSVDDIKPKVEKLSEEIGYIKERKFSNLSVSTSFIYKISDIVHVGANLSKSSRVPSIEELFSEGPHLAAYSFEIGNPDLKSEEGYGTELFVYHKFDNLFFNLNLFYNNLNSFIIPRNTGRINYQTFLPIYATEGVGAILYGIDGSLSSKLIGNFNLDFLFNYTVGKFKDSDSPLPQIPPLKGTTEINYKNEALAFGLSSEWAFNQNKVDTFEQPTQGYIIFNLYGQYMFYLGNTINTISLNVDNILNKEYRNHLSRIKSILPEAGRNLRLIYKLML